MNEFDSERIEFILKHSGYLKVNQPQRADIIIFNTCSVRKKAEDRMYGHIGNLKSMKAENSQILICVGGCTAQSLGEKILKDLPHVDIVFGTRCIDRLPELLDKKPGIKGSICDVAEYPDTFDSIYNYDRGYNFKAYLPVSVGCNNFCSYCIVPYVRGREKSMEPEKIIKEIEKLTDDGVVEVMLLGQNVNSYGNDFDPLVKNYDFSSLLEDISMFKSLKRIRFMTSHPKDFKKNLVNVIKENKNIMNHIHLPLQAGSDKVLRLMNRKYRRKEFIGIYNYIKDKIPDCAVTTDIIVGFPGETAHDFKQTLEMVEKLRFHRAFTFVYSPRRGTRAEGFSDTISSSEKQKWFAELLELQNNISLEENNKFIGTEIEVLVEGKNDKKDDQYEGRLENNLIVNFESRKDLTGKFVNIKVVEAKSFYLIGELSKNVS
jgi:tRNA-2-methylthio-N6-dimethylallyladenosine synthase